MGPDGNIDCAQSRLQARHGERLRAGDWRLLEASRDLQHFLAATSHSMLGRWVAALTAEMEVHEIERTLRRESAAYVDEVAAWLPRAWRPAFEWLRWLPQLQLFAQLARAEPTPAWMFADAVFGPIAPGSATDRARAMESSSLAPLAPAVRGEVTITQAWLSRWRRLLPRTDRETGAYLATLEKISAGYAETARSAGQAFGPLRQALEERILRLFRRSASTPVAALCHLALVALDVERLRGDLVLRATLDHAGRKS